MKYIYVVIAVVFLVFGFQYFRSDEDVAPAPIVNNYNNDTYRFSINVPEGFTKDENHTYQVNPQNTISGVKFTIPKGMSDGTNLGSDTYISIESKPGAINSCSAEIYLDAGVSSGFIDSGGHRYSVAKSSGAGAGNRYDETVFATPVDGGCIAVRYFIHYSVFENYPEGTVTKFDEEAIKGTFDLIRKSLVLN